MLITPQKLVQNTSNGNEGYTVSFQFWRKYEGNMIFLIVIFVVQSEDFMWNFWSRIFLCKMFLNSLYFLDSIVKVFKMIILPYRSDSTFSTASKHFGYPLKIRLISKLFGMRKVDDITTINRMIKKVLPAFVSFKLSGPYHIWNSLMAVWMAHSHIFLKLIRIRTCGFFSGSKVLSLLRECIVWQPYH